ncbi:MAG: polysaccharide deacetylase family protein [Paludibacteraceae bacterium]|nr:polysaccharide deacetylase family protein [Paludibacteraceae bacterium]
MLYQFPSWLQHLYGNVVWRGDVAARVVYLTFDDGPIPEVTPRVLDILGYYGIKATFFCVGENVVKHADIFQRMIAEGHAVGNHTYNHLAGWQTPTDKYLLNVEKAQEAMLAQGADTNLFRPPYGRMRFSQKKVLKDKYQIVLWDVLTHDYNSSYTPQKILDVVRRYTRNGSIINFHDSLKSEKNMLAALPLCIEWLTENGYICKTLCLK